MESIEQGPTGGRGRIGQLPLQPSKKNPRVRRHQRPGGDEVLEQGEGNFIEPKVMDRLVDQVNRDHKGKSAEEKIAELKKLMEAHQKGDVSPTGIPGRGQGREDYLASFRDFVGKLPKKFDEFVPQSMKQEGDQLIQTGQTTGYNIDSYGVGKAGEYSAALKEGSGKVLYHQYVTHPDHGEELLKRLQSLNLSTPYTMTTLATTVAWDKEWGEEPEIELEETESGTMGRSVQYVLVFAPRDKSQADKLVAFFERNAKHGQKEALPHSWFVQDIRSSFSEKVDEFEQNILNTKRKGEYDLMLLKKEAMDGFEASRIWLNSDLSEFIKSLAIFVTAPFKGTPVVFGRLSKGISRITRKGRYFVIS